MSKWDKFLVVCLSVQIVFCVLVVLLLLSVG